MQHGQQSTSHTCDMPRVNVILVYAYVCCCFLVGDIPKVTVHNVGHCVFPQMGKVFQISLHYSFSSREWNHR